MSKTSSSNNKNLLIVGAGNMGSAICECLVTSQFYGRNHVYVINPGEEKRTRLSSNFNVKVFEDAKSFFNFASDKILDSLCILLAVKPQVLKDVCIDLFNFGLSNNLIISIAAGVKADSINSYFDNTCRVVRVMPNIALLVNEAMSGICPSTTSNDDDLNFTQDLFNLMGKTIVVEEDQMDIVCALSGSGPAFFEAIVKYMSEVAQDLGLDGHQANLLALQTMFGTSKLVLDKELDLQSAIDSVCSPGGTTLAGLDKMEDLNLEDAIKEGVRSAHNRSIELGS
ncbi:MAG: pyrroline-5-carboxylate reductase [Coriobacteriales bacterium]|nr:pyrroline-5-carboxylate reductase [Coriobacteriales bacterium]